MTMQAQNFSVEQLLAMAHSPVHNYAIPGLTSYLIGTPSPAGTVRLFHCTRDHQEAITPHSHRFDFQCWVLQGGVVNRVWKELYHSDENNGDLFTRTVLNFRGGPGKYELGDEQEVRYAYDDKRFKAGECYGMKAHEIHSIYFARDTRVLFFEGPTISNSSVILQPCVDGETIPTFKVEPWMFKREET
jgi:hypothetical protein